METTDKKTAITVETTVKAPVERVWDYWNEPEHITQWYNASDDWHAPAAENDLRVDGKMKITMAAKDGSVRFDVEGVYTEVEEHKLVAFTLLDGRKVKINFSSNGDETKVTETFDPEETNPLDMQKGGWQAIIDNFKRYVEAN